MSPLRTTTKLLRLSSHELAAIEERAHRCGVTPARFIREAALGLILRARRGAADDALVRELARVSHDLHALARDPHRDARDSSAAAIDGTLRELLDVVRRLT